MTTTATYTELATIDKTYCQKEYDNKIVTLEEVKSTFNKWLYLEDDTVIDMVMGVVIANKWKCDPVWIFLVAPPSSGKTEILRSFKHPEGKNLDGFYSLSKLTENTLISGLELGNNKKDYSLLPKLDNKVVIIKDFTSILNMRREAREAVFNDLRECYDGYLEKEYGSTAQSKGHKAKFGLLCGVTPIVDDYYSFSQALGERFLKYRIKIKDRQKLRERAIDNNEKKKEMRLEISKVVEGYIKSIRVPDMEDIKLDGDLKLKVEKLADFLSVARSSVSRDGYSKEIKFIPEPENPCRIAGQLSALLKGVSAARGKKAIDDKDYEIVVKVVKDSLPSIRYGILVELVMNRGGITTSRLAEITSLPTATTKLILEDFTLLGLVKKFNRTEDYKQNEGYKWEISEDILNLILETGL